MLEKTRAIQDGWVDCAYTTLVDATNMNYDRNSVPWSCAVPNIDNNWNNPGRQLSEKGTFV